MPQGLVHCGVVLGVVLIVSGGAIAVLGVIPALPPNRSIPVFFMIAGALLLGIGAIWYFYGTPVAKNIPEHDISAQLLWECEWTTLPHTIPGGGRINTFQASLNEDGTGALIGFGSKSGQPGAQSGYDQLEVNVMAQRCSLTNFGDETIFNVAMTIGASFIEATKKPDGTFDNKVVATTSTQFLISSLDSGRDRPFVAYLFSLDPKRLVQFNLPLTASYITDQAGPRKEARFLPPSMNPVTVFPPTPKSGTAQ
jgi:hypothetical protein